MIHPPNTTQAINHPAQQEALNTLHNTQKVLWNTALTTATTAEEKAAKQLLKTSARQTNALLIQTKKDNKTKNQHTFNSNIDQQQGHIHHNIVRTALVQELTLPDDIMTQAVLAGNLELVQLLKYKNYPLNADDYATALTSQHFTLAKWIFIIIEKNERNKEQIITSTTNSQQQHLMQQVRNYFPMTGAVRLISIKLAITNHDLDDFNLLISEDVNADSFPALVTHAYQQKNAVMLHAVLQQWPTRDTENNVVTIPGDLYSHIIEQYELSKTELITTIQASTRTTTILCRTLLSLAALGLCSYSTHIGTQCFRDGKEKDEEGDIHYHASSLCYIKHLGGIIGVIVFTLSSICCIFWLCLTINDNNKAGPSTLIQAIQKRKTLYDSHMAMFDVLAKHHLRPTEQDLTALASNADDIIPKEMKAHLEEIAGHTATAARYRQHWCSKWFNMGGDDRRDTEMVEGQDVNMPLLGGREV